MSLAKILGRVVVGAAVCLLLGARNLATADELSSLAQERAENNREGHSAAASTTAGVSSASEKARREEAAAKASKPLAARSSLAGIDVDRHVPVQQLPPGKIVYVFDAIYRVIGADARFSKLEESGMAAAMQAAWARLNQVPSFEINVTIMPAIAAPGSSEDPCEPHEEKEFCSMRSYEGAKDYFAVDVNVRTGVTRGTLFPGIGEKEWTYNRLLDSMLRDRGYEARVTIMQIRLVPEGVHVLKHIPFVAHYAEETVLQLEGLNLMPFSLPKQNLLLMAVDCVGLNNMAGVGYTRLTNVSEAWKWTKEGGDVGVANITMVTIRDRPLASVPEALNASLPRLLEMLDRFGLKHISNSVLSSHPLKNSTLADMITTILPEDERVRSYDSRVPFETLPPVWPIPPPSNLPPWLVIVAAALATMALILGSRMYLRAQRSRRKAPEINPFSFLVDELGPESRISGSGLPKGAVSAVGSGLSSRTSPNPFQGQFEGANCNSASLHRQQDSDITVTGDSATETAGIAGVPEERRRQQIKKEMERASSIHGWEIDPGDIQICKTEDGNDHLIGTGGFGQVYKGVRSGVQDVAVKMLSYSNDLQLQQFCLEIRLLKSLSFDRNVVQFYGACLRDDHPMMILELMEGGDLRNALSGHQREEMTWYQNGQHLALDIIRGICYLHNNRVIHGDLKSRNVLLTRNGASAKISDVGMARIMSTTISAQSFQPSPPGTFSHAAPELLLGQRCTAKADVFSYGVTLWEIITGDIPIRGRLRAVRVPEECPQVISDLIDRCLEAEPDSRPTAKEVFELVKTAQSVQPPTLRSSSVSSSGALRSRISARLSQVSED